ncbi:MAG: trehalose-6-phosphate synthase, partial [Bacteroidota bacterium]
MSLVLVANRAPVRPTPDGWASSLGGLASALLPVLERQGGAWVSMRPPDADTPLRQSYPDQNPAFEIRRVPLDAAEYEAFYEGMSNRVLWPISHYLIELVEPDR